MTDSYHNARHIEEFELLRDTFCEFLRGLFTVVVKELCTLRNCVQELFALTAQLFYLLL